ncbi:hypothetical protein KI387_014830, partial [Taxus chinensis]
KYEGQYPTKVERSGWVDEPGRRVHKISVEDLIRQVVGGLYFVISTWKRREKVQ